MSNPLYRVDCVAHPFEQFSFLDLGISCQRLSSDEDDILNPKFWYISWELIQMRKLSYFGASTLSFVKNVST